MEKNALYKVIVVTVSTATYIENLEEETMPFYNFMMRDYFNGHGRKSDLAYDMKSDKSSFPKNSKGKYTDWHKLIYEYLTVKGACHDAILVFEECWKGYLECEKRK